MSLQFRSAELGYKWMSKKWRKVILGEIRNYEDKQMKLKQVLNLAKPPLMNTLDGGQNSCCIQIWERHWV